MTSGPQQATDRVARRRRVAVWGLSLVGGAVLLALASTRIAVVPTQFTIVDPLQLALAIAVYFPYAWLRAARLRFVVDPVLRRRSGDEDARVPPALLHGSGYVSFFVLMMLPLRLGELSRPLLLASGGVRGLGMAEALAPIAAERILDGLLVVGLLLGGLAFAGLGTEGDTLAYVFGFGRVMGSVFLAATVVLLLHARFPDVLPRGLRRIAPDHPLVTAFIAFIERLGLALSPLLSLRQGVPLLLASLAYWGLVILQLRLVLGAAGLELGLAGSAVLVAMIGLSIQLPGGPAMAGSFQLGAAAGLSLFFAPEIVEGPGSTFTALLYVLHVAGAALLFPVGGWLIRSDRRARGLDAGSAAAVDSPVAAGAQPADGVPPGL